MKDKSCLQLLEATKRNVKWIREIHYLVFGEDAAVCSIISREYFERVAF